jgi:hypothetical protein
VGDGVEEGVLTLVAANLTDDEDGVENDAGDQDREEDDAQDEQRKVALVVDDPGDVEEDGEAGEQYAKRDEDCNGSAASIDIHAQALGESIRAME